jgi:hypothetical protein
MSKRLDNLSRVFLELRDRYGANDPLVLQVKQELTVCEDAESLYVERILPFGERRALTPEPHYWNVQPRNRRYSPSRAAVIGECRRVGQLVS